MEEADAAGPLAFEDGGMYTLCLRVRMPPGHPFTQLCVAEAAQPGVGGQGQGLVGTQVGCAAGVGPLPTSHAAVHCGGHTAQCGRAGGGGGQGGRAFLHVHAGCSSAQGLCGALRFPLCPSWLCTDARAWQALHHELQFRAWMMCVGRASHPATSQRRCSIKGRMYTNKCEDTPSLTVRVCHAQSWIRHTPLFCGANHKYAGSVAAAGAGAVHVCGGLSRQRGAGAAKGGGCVLKACEGGFQRVRVNFSNPSLVRA